MMAYVGPENSQLYQQYLLATCNTKIRDKFKFVHSFDYENVEIYPDQKGKIIYLAPVIVFFRNFNDPVSLYTGEPNSLEITKYAFAKSQRLVKPFSQEIVHQMFVEQKPAIILF